MRYNGQKEKHSIKFQAATTLDGLLILLYGPEVGERNNVYLRTASGLDSALSQSLWIDAKQYIVFENSGYSLRVFLETQFASANLTTAQRTFNKATAMARITDEKFFMVVKRVWGLTDANQKKFLRKMPA